MEAFKPEDMSLRQSSTGPDNSITSVWFGQRDTGRRLLRQGRSYLTRARKDQTQDHRTSPLV